MLNADAVEFLFLYLPLNSSSGPSYYTQKSMPSFKPPPTAPFPPPCAVLSPLVAELGSRTAARARGHRWGSKNRILPDACTRAGPAEVGRRAGSRIYNIPQRSESISRAPPSPQLMTIHLPRH